MLIITLDHDTDAITIQTEDDAVLYRRHGHITPMPIAEHVRDLRAVGGIVEELLHVLDHQGVTLRRQDEGQLATIAEW